MARRELDAYFTAPWMTRTLLREHHIAGRVLEPCAGDGSIANVLRDTDLEVDTNDIDPNRPADTHCDAAEMFFGEYDWIVTNPPYQMPLCLNIVLNTLQQARVGVAMLLRLSFLEPTRARAPFWKQYPLSRLLVLPRYSFTGDGKSDSVTTAWFVWDKRKADYDDWVHADPMLASPVVSLGDAKSA